MNNWTKILLLILCLNLSLFPVSAQSTGDVFTYKFEVEDINTSQPLRGVACRVFTPEGKIRGYALSDKDGLLSVKAKNGDRIEFGIMGYAKEGGTTGDYSTSQRNLIKMSRKEIELREVVVKAPPVRARKDTIAYDVKSFLKQGDTYLEDVLKKLPGISVSENGRVSYQGQGINKFYIEGKDLLGASYNQATKNLPVDAVTTVEVLENHQPVNMLRGKQFSDKAALNIRIDKKHHIKPFGEIEGGAGLSPALWTGRIFLTQIMNQSQMMVTAKTNNTGESLSSETEEHVNVMDMDAYIMLPSPVLSTSYIGQSLPLARYLRNRSVSAGVNYLMSPSKESTLRVNLLFHNDRSLFEDENISTFGGLETVTLRENSHLKKKTLSVMPILKYELNGKRLFLSDELKYSFRRDRSEGDIATHLSTVNENIGQRPAYIQNYFKTVLSVGRSFLDVKSVIRYFDRRETLGSIADTISLYDISEVFATKSFITRNLGSTSFYIGKNLLSLGLKAEYSDQLYESDTRQRNTNLLLRFAPGYQIRMGSYTTLSIKLPMSWNRICFSPDGFDGTTESYFLVSPSLSFYWQVFEKLKFSVSASTDKNVMPENFYSPYEIRTGYRTFYHSTDDIFMNRSYRVNGSLRYADLASLFFSSLTVGYTRNNRDAYREYQYTDSVTMISMVRGKDNSDDLNATLNVDKSFIDAGLSIKSSLNYNRRKYLMAQSGVLTDNVSNVWNLMLDINFQKFSWMSFNCKANGMLYSQDNSFSSSIVRHALTTEAKISFYPLKSIDINLSYFNYTNELKESVYKSYGFVDAALKWRVAKRVTLSMKASNLLDTKRYSVTTDSGINVFSYSQPLRGREFLFSVLFGI